jgi:type II secretory pathway pseudopilin PulG
MNTARRECSAGLRLRQRGAALLITLALIGVICGLAVLWVAGGNATQAKRVQKSARAMGMIRDALVARAAADLNRPGSLPCPDVNNDGLSTPAPDWTGSTCATYIGRVPWKTLDLPDLRDADGERFWYALSPVFRDSTSAGTLNSDTVGTLTVNLTGTPPVTNVVAIIFAPGASLPGQNRNPANTVAMSELPHYLDADNNNADATYQAGPETATFNDELLVITRDMLMPAVE